MPDIPPRLRKIMSRGIEFETGPIIVGRSFQGTKIEPGIIYSRGSKINLGPTGRTMLSRGQEIPTGPQISEAEAVFRAQQGVIAKKSTTTEDSYRHESCVPGIETRKTEEPITKLMKRLEDSYRHESCVPGLKEQFARKKRWDIREK